MIEQETCRYCGGECPHNHEYMCDGYSGDIDNLYEEKTIKKEGVNKMKNKEVKLKTKLTRNEIEELLEVYQIMDAICDDFKEMFDTDLSKVRKLEEMSYKLKSIFDFRPRTGEDGSPNHWRPYVMPDDDRAWFHKPEEDK